MALASLNMPQTMLAYVNWASRFIQPRRRTVSYAPAFWKSQAAMERGGDVLALEAAVKAGSNLTPYLSGRVLSDGYQSGAENGEGKQTKWADKDFALNAYGIHHLHFVPANGKSRGAEQGKHGHLLYVEFGRYHATFLMVGDHKSFDDGTLHDAVIEARASSGAWELQGIRPPRNPEDHKDEFRLARRGFATTAVKDGRVFIAANLSTAGTSPRHTRHASHILRALSVVDPELDKDSYWRERFASFGRSVPTARDFEWSMQYTELSVIERCSQTKLIIVDGLT
ncbi:hypothetical protein OIU35_07030 [Boseaceae bacterium BT-24-1]|nr:hypothetical protein [Boseaceae bacterium BT-24-1]